MTHLSNAGRMCSGTSRHPFRSAASVVGVGLPAILVVGFVFIDAMDHLATIQFSIAERQDVSVRLSSRASAPPRARPPAGGRRGQPQRLVPGTDTGGTPPNIAQRRVPMPGCAALSMSRPALASAFGLVLPSLACRAWREIRRPVFIEVLEGQRPVRELLSLIQDDMLTFGTPTSIRCTACSGKATLSGCAARRQHQESRCGS